MYVIIRGTCANLITFVQSWSYILRKFQQVRGPVVYITSLICNYDD